MNQTAQDFFKKGLQLCQEANFEAAIEEFSRALALEHAPDIFYNRAKAYFKLQDFSKAINDFSSLISHEPSNAFYYSERGVAYHLSGDSTKALEDLDKAAALEPMKPFRYSSRAFIKEKTGDLRGAIADYEKAIELDPEDAIAFNNKGLIEEKLGYLENSRKSFARADELDPPKKVPGATEKAEKPKSAGKAPLQEKVTPAPTPVPTKDSLTLTSYLGTLKQLITNGKEQKEFISFIKNLGRTKK